MHSVKNLNARGAFYPVALDAITSNHYIDETETQAVRAIMEIVIVQARTGFQLAVLNSNRERVLEHVPVETRARAAKELGGNDPHEAGKS